MAPGDLIVAADAPAEIANQFEATVVWLADAPLLRGRSYALRIGAASANASINPLKYKINLSTLDRNAATTLVQKEIGVCNLQLDRALPFDPFKTNRDTGGFVLVDKLSGATVGAGMLHFALRRAQNVVWQAVDVNKAARAGIKGQKPCVLWYTGLSGAGKSTIANLVDKRLHAASRHTYLLDGDNVRHGLNRDLGFTDADRVENIRRIGEVAKLMVDAGLIVSTAFISPFRAERQMARALVADGRVRRDLHRHAAGSRRAARSEGAVQEGAARRSQELHRHRFAVRASRHARADDRHDRGLARGCGGDGRRLPAAARIRQHRR